MMFSLELRGLVFRGLIVMLSASLALAEDDFFDGVDAASEPVMARARERIEELRKGDVVLHFVDQNGKPVNAPATIELKRHAFAFGASLNAILRLKPEHPARQPSLDIIDELFNMVRIGDNWHVMEPTFDCEPQWQRADQGLAWAIEHDKHVRYHCVIYNFRFGFSNVTWRDRLKTADDWWPRIERRVRLVGERYGDRVEEFEIMNEMLTSRPWAKGNNPTFPSLGLPINGARLMKTARRHMPDAVLMANEAGIATTVRTNHHFKGIVNYYRRLIELGAPLDAVGYQAHFLAKDDMPFEEGHPVAGPGAFTMAKLDKGLDLLGSLGKPVHLTEFSAPSRHRDRGPDQPRVTDEEAAAWAVNFYTLAFSKPYVDQIIHWYVADKTGAGSSLDSGLLDAQGREKPLARELRRLLTETWTTRWSGVIKGGQAALRGFYGDYEVSVKGYEPARFELTREGDEQAIALQLVAVQ